MAFVSEGSWDGPTAPNCALSPDVVIRKEHWLLKPDTIVSWLCDSKHTLPLWGYFLISRMGITTLAYILTRYLRADERVGDKVLL